jgi:hypothetical protein
MYTVGDTPIFLQKKIDCNRVSRPRGVFLKMWNSFCAMLTSPFSVLVASVAAGGR